MKRKTFVLGMGAHKAGTSWLHAQLNALPFANFGNVKEYHVWDAIHFPNGQQNAYLLDAQRSSWNRLPLFLHKNINPMKLRRSFIRKPSIYFDYFERLTGWRHPKVSMTGDITPRYSGLSEYVLSELRAELIDRGFKVKAVIILRDPVERLWSAVRMHRRNRRGAATDLVGNSSSDDAIVLQMLGNGEVEIFSRYDKIIPRLKNVFPTEDMHIALYENFFNAQSWQSLMHALGVSAPSPNFDEFVNQSPKNVPLMEETIAIVAKHYRPCYELAERLFGIDTIAEAWPSKAYISPIAPATPSPATRR